MTPTTAAPERLAAVRWNGRWIDGAELGEHARQVAAALADLGVGSGDTVALLLRNCVEAVVAQRAIALLGAYAVPLNWHGSADELSYVLDDCGAQVVIAHAGLWSPSLTRRDPRVVLVPDASAATASPGAIAWDDLRSDAPVPTGRPRDGIIYTSGTTGRPKGVRRAVPTAEQEAWTRWVRSTIYGIRPGARVLLSAPLYHAAPAQLVQFALPNAEAIVLEERFDARATLAVIAEERITHMFAVPTMFSRILQLPEDERRAHDLSSLEFVLHAGAPCPVPLKRRMIEEWGPVLFEYYGSTELGPVTFCDSREWLAHPGTVGRPLDGVEVIRVDDGELAIRSPGYPDFEYIGMPAERASLQRGDYVATGDVGSFSEDGYLFITDRVRDLVISGGVNIYPAEIEAVALELDAVADCAAFGIPDEDLGEVLALLVEPAAGVAADRAAVAAHLASRLGTLKVPRLIEFRERLPREENGKIRKRLLREAYWASA